MAHLEIRYRDALHSLAMNSGNSRHPPGSGEPPRSHHAAIGPCSIASGTTPFGPWFFAEPLEQSFTRTPVGPYKPSDDNRTNDSPSRFSDRGRGTEDGRPSGESVIEEEHSSSVHDLGHDEAISARITIGTTRLLPEETLVLISEGANALNYRLKRDSLGRRDARHQIPLTDALVVVGNEHREEGH